MEGNTFFGDRELELPSWMKWIEKGWCKKQNTDVDSKKSYLLAHKPLRQWQENYPSPSSLVHVKIEAYKVHFKTNLYSWIPRRTNFAQPQIVILEEGEKFMEANVIIKRVTSPRLRERTRGQWPYSACVKPISMLWTEMWFANELLSNIL